MSCVTGLVAVIALLPIFAAESRNDAGNAAIEWTKAVMKQDGSALRRILADGLTYAHADGVKVQTKAQYIAAVTSGSGARDVLALRDVIAHDYDNFAVVSAYLDVTRNGQALAPARIMQMYVKAGRQWRLAASAATEQAGGAPSAPPPPAVAPLRLADSPEAGAVRNAALAWTQAMVKKDRSAIEPVLAEKLLFAHSNGGVPRNRKEHLASTESNRYESLTLSGEQIRIYKNGAVLTGHIDTKNIGQDSFRVRTIQIFVNTGGVWQLAAFQSTRVRPSSQ